MSDESHLNEVEQLLVDVGYSHDRVVKMVADSLNEEVVAWAVNNCERLFEALESAHATIEALHGEPGWSDYQHSPEMKQINTALAKAKQSK